MAYETEYTDFDPQEDSSACLTLGLATDIVESRYLRDFSTAEPEEKQQILKDLTTFLEQLLRQPQISGSADAWHNLCVVLAQCDLYNLACITLERGLDFYPKSVDLLADYLQYGMECGQGERCKAVCKTLVKIPKFFWSWRGYRFLIGYETQLSLSGSEKELEKYKAEIDQLLKLYRQQFPDDEGSYDCEADVCRDFNDHRREEAHDAPDAEGGDEQADGQIDQTREGHACAGVGQHPGVGDGQIAVGVGQHGSHDGEAAQIGKGRAEEGRYFKLCNAVEQKCSQTCHKQSC